MTSAFVDAPTKVLFTWVCNPILIAQEGVHKIRNVIKNIKALLIPIFLLYIKKFDKLKISKKYKKNHKILKSYKLKNHHDC